MPVAAMLTALAPAASAALQLAAAGVKRAQEVGEINVYLDRSKILNDLFEKDEDKAHEAWGKLMAEIFRVLATKGITPSIPWRDEEKQIGSPCVSIPVATIKELLDASTR